MQVLLRGALVMGLATPSAAADHDVLSRGQYIVDRVGMCADCHSPRDATGRFIWSEWLRGAPVGITPNQPMPEWATVAPPLAGLPPGYAEADLVTFLTSGKRPDGKAARPPMPEYRLDVLDAQAVTTYLKSLQPQ